MTDIMLDIETLGTIPGSIILSIGAVAFDKGGLRDEFYVAVDAKSAQAIGLTSDPDTVRWWAEQSEDAQAAAFSGESDLTQALNSLAAWVKTIEPERVWAKPPSFDIVLLEAAFRLVGIEIPWNFRQPRDLRTLIDLTGAVQPVLGTAHNALDDARCQALAVIDGWLRIGVRGHG